MKELQIGSIVGNGIFIGYLMTECSDVVRDFNLLHDKLKDTKDRGKILDVLKKNITFRYLFLIEPDIIYTLPLTEQIQPTGIGQVNLTKLNATQLHWKNGLPVDLSKAQIYESVDKYLDTIVDSYIYCSQASDKIQKSDDMVAEMYEVFKEDIIKSLNEKGWYKLGSMGFMVRKKKNFVLMMILQGYPKEGELEEYFYALHMGKRVKRPKCMKEIPLYKCSIRADEKDFKKFFCLSFRFVADVENRIRENSKNTTCINR